MKESVGFLRIPSATGNPKSEIFERLRGNERFSVSNGEMQGVASSEAPFLVVHAWSLSEIGLVTDADPLTGIRLTFSEGPNFDPGLSVWTELEVKPRGWYIE